MQANLKLVKWLTSLIRYRQGLLFLVLINIYLIMIIPYSWLYYDVRYYLEWYEVTWSKGYLILAFNPGVFTIPVIIIPRGLLYIYVYAAKASYPPIPILLFITTHTCASAVSSSLQIIRLIDKLPLVIAFNLTYIILKKYYGWKAGVLWLLSGFPYLTINNYHVDVLVALFLLLSIVYLTRKNNALLAGVFLALAGLIKPLVVIAGLVHIVYLFRKAGFKNAVAFVVAGLATGVLISAPFLYINARAFLAKAVFFHSERYPQEYSLWAIPIYAVNYNMELIPSWLKYAWLPVYVGVLVLLIKRLVSEREFSEEYLIKYTLTSLIISFLAIKVGNITYFTWAVPLIAAYAAINHLYRNERFMLLYIFTSLALTVLAPFTTFYSAYVVQGSVYIVEDLSYYSVVDLTRKSIDEITIQYILGEYFRVYAYRFFEYMYMGLNISYIIYTLIYNSYLIYLLKILYGKH